MKEKFTIIAREYVVSLFPAFNLVDAFSRGVKKVIGHPVYLAAVIEDGALRWCALMPSWRGAHEALVAKIKKDPDFMGRVFQKTEQLGKEQIRATRIFKGNLKSWSNRDLFAAYEQYLQTNATIYAYGLLAPLLDFQETTFLSDELKTILQRRGREEYFDVLTRPGRETYNKQQDLDLLRIFSFIQKRSKLRRIFKEQKAEELSRYLSQNYPALWRKLKTHANKYAWVNYVYEGPAAVTTYFLDILRDFVRRKINPQKLLAEHYQQKEQTRKEQTAIRKKLKFTAYEAKIATLARDVVFFKPYRRELQSCSYYQMEFLLREIARRLALGLRQVRMMLPEEIRSALLRGVIAREEINRRLHSVVYAVTPRGQICLSGPAARNFIDKNIKKERQIKKVKEITGAVAYSGRAKGRIKIVNAPHDMIKMKEGDILVAHATSPNLMPAIRRAAAIVTDEGGLTSHAAIVAREFKIPCVIGTKIATKVFRDGDMVEVDAERGVVKKQRLTR